MKSILNSNPPQSFSQIMFNTILNFAYKFAPRSFWNLARTEFYLFRVRLKEKSLREKFRQSNDVLVNFGAGDAGKAGWVNVDAYPCPGINLIWDCRYPFPLPDSCAKGVFTEHFFEHVDYENDAPVFLKECFRIMQPNAVIRIIVPDAGAFVRAYCTNDWDDLTQLRLLSADKIDPNYNLKYETKMQLLNVLFRQFQEHKYAYDYETLECLLRASGFKDIRRSEFGSSAMPEIAIDLARRKQESLYVEAVKS